MMCGSTHERNWQKSGSYGASVLQEAPHLRQLLPTLDRARHDALREMHPSAFEVPENPLAPNYERDVIIRRASVCGATSAPGLPLTSVANGAKIGTRSRSDWATEDLIATVIDFETEKLTGIG